MEAVIDSLTSLVAAFDADYEALFVDLTRLCQALGAGAGAEDLAQDALVFGRAHLRELRDPAKLRPWLRRIAARSVGRARDDQRRDRSEAAFEFLPIDRDLGIDAAAAITRLPARERLSVALVYGLGYEQHEAADVLGIARGTVAALLWRARRRLAIELADYAGKSTR